MGSEFLLNFLCSACLVVALFSFFFIRGSHAISSLLTDQVIEKGIDIVQACLVQKTEEQELIITSYDFISFCFVIFYFYNNLVNFASRLNY
ncbi:hypothetical protein ACJX0J_023440, partial [Zea mays]